MPGQTRVRSAAARPRLPDPYASMEGRAIARPNTWRPAVAAARLTLIASMEGRAIARPNSSTAGQPAHRRTPTLQWRAGQLPGQTERSATVLRWIVFVEELQWRAGQLPGQTGNRRSMTGTAGPDHPLQWRAGQLPGQTTVAPNRPRVTLDELAASMEGRAIARPNGLGRSHVEPVADSGLMSASMEGRAIARPNSASASGARIPSGRVRGFNGGPGNCPAKPGAPPLWARCRRLRSSFNGGPGNCPAKPLVKIGALDLPVCGRLRAVVEA